MASLTCRSTAHGDRYVVRWRDETRSRRSVAFTSREAAEEFIADLAAAADRARAQAVIGERVGALSSHYAAIFAAHRVISEKFDVSAIPDVAGVYFIQAANGKGLIKIGVAANIRQRFVAIQACSPVLLTVLAAIPGAGAREEAALHQQFATDREHGEWFRPAAVRRYIDEALQRGHHSEQEEAA